MHLPKSKVFLIFCLSFLLGVLLSPILPKIVMVVSAMIFIMFASIGFRSRNAKVLGLAGLILLAGSLRYQSAVGKNNLAPFYGRNAEVIGTVVEEPDLRQDKTLLTLGRLKLGDTYVEDRLLVTVYPYRNYNYGDQIHFIGKIGQPKEFEDFNYKNYLSRFGIHAVMYYPANDLLATGKGNLIKAGLLGVKHEFVKNLGYVLPEPQNAFLAGLLLGSKRSIPQNYIDAFNATGTSHIIAISGYNITIIAWALDLLLRRFGKRVSLFGSVLAILAFVILTGASASVIRAAIMGALGLIALNTGRLFNINAALAATASGMVLYNPQILLSDVGFQLSFVALAGLVYLSPILSRYFQFLPDWLGKPLVATLSAQIFALPILVYNFDQLSLIAPLTNVLILELVPLTMLFGFLTGFMGFVWTPLAAVFSWPAWICLSYILKVVDLTAKIPFASLAVHLNLPAVISYYTALISLLVWSSFRAKAASDLPQSVFAALPAWDK